MSRQERVPIAIDDLIIRTLQGRATPEEEAKLRRLRSRTQGGAANERRFRRVAELWDLAGLAGDPDESGMVTPDAETIVGRASEPTPVDWEPGHLLGEGAPRSGAAGPQGKERRRRAHRPRRLLVGGMAAGLTALGFGLGLLSSGVWGEAGEAAGLSEVEVRTGPEELTTVMLGDGTAIRVGPESMLRLSGQGEEVRGAWLEGKAFFGVEADEERSFTVRTTYGDAMALGTRFEVSTEAEEFRVLVVEGSVRVTASGSEVEVGEGVMSRSPGGEPPETAAVENMEDLLAWMGPTLVFRGTTLQRAIEEIEQRYGVEVEVEDESLLEMTVTGTFTVLPVERVMSVICEIVGAECEIQGDRIRIQSSGAGPDGVRIGGSTSDFGAFA